jgi:hypothetical protein
MDECVNLSLLVNSLDFSPAKYNVRDNESWNGSVLAI